MKGRGLGALFPKIPGREEEEEEMVLPALKKPRQPRPKDGSDVFFKPSFPEWKQALVSVKKISAPSFMDASRKEGASRLQRSISVLGVLFPILVRKTENGFELVAGLRRLEACKNLGISKIPARVARLEPRQAEKIYRESNLV